MKQLILLPVLFISMLVSAQNIGGSWKLTHIDGQEVNDTETIKIYKDGYFAFGTKETGSNKFLAASGGEYSAEDGYYEKYDFHTVDSTLVGTKVNFEKSYSDDDLVLTETGRGITKTWKRVSGNQNDLSGNWVITGRKRNGELRQSTPGARRTIKILGGDRFQWAAFNSDTGEFFGTGGGTYSAENGKYSENIEFFSRDDSRVGAKLDFDYTIKDGEWHHSGKSSKGDPMYEIWSPYRKYY